MDLDRTVDQWSSSTIYAWRSTASMAAKKLLQIRPSMYESQCIVIMISVACDVTARNVLNSNLTGQCPVLEVTIDL
jgi:hypothetical protein